MIHFALLLAAAAPTAVQPAPRTVVAVKPSEAAVAEAIGLLDTDGFDQNVVRSADLTVGLALASMVEAFQKQYGEDLPQDLVDQLRATIHDFTVEKMNAHLQDMKRQTAEIYAQNFTRAELVRLRELHSDPVAVKARELAPTLQPRLMMIGVNTMRSEQPELDAKIERLVEKYFETHDRKSSNGSS